MFKRGHYNTTFYHWVARWFHKEWEDARLRAGAPASLRERMEVLAGLWLTRAMVRALSWLPGAQMIRFQPAEGR